MTKNDEVNNELSELNSLKKEIIRSLSNEVDDIERVLASNNLSNLEKSMHLGAEMEDVLYQYTFDELDIPDTYKKIEMGLNDERVNKVIINGKIIPEELIRIVKQAKKHDIPFTIKIDPQFVGEIALELIKQE